MKPSKFMTKAELERVATAVFDAEQNTSGEICVKIISGLEKGVKTNHEQAVREFYKEGMDKTRDKTGVLILLVLSTRAIEVVADFGINERVEQETWDLILYSMTDAIRRGNRCQALCDAVKAIGKILSQHFPRKSDDTNELSNTVITGS